TKSTSITEELDSALFLKNQACEAFSNLSKSIKNNKPVVMNEVMPIIDDSINSLIRNNQALLTLMHMQRSEKDLFSHSFSTMSLLLSLAMFLNYSEEQLRNFGIAALLHDLGWSKIPLHLLAKNKTYTKNEKKIVQQHLLIIVQQLLADKNNEHEVVKLISQHHERGDGSGYPKGLELKDLSEESSLLALVDYYDELIHGLLDRSGVIPSVALKFLYKEALNGKFYKKHVEQLINLLGIYPLTSAVKLASGEKGVVIAANYSDPLKPCIKIMYGTSGRAITQPYIIDLNNDDQSREISQVLDISDQKQDPLQLLVVKEEQVMTNG
ncbi:MAG: HD domain-containing protein, partial [Pseudomonadota bacterium]